MKVFSVNTTLLSLRLKSSRSLNPLSSTEPLKLKWMFLSWPLDTFLQESYKVLASHDLASTLLYFFFFMFELHQRERKPLSHYSHSYWHIVYIRKIQLFLERKEPSPLVLLNLVYKGQRPKSLLRITKLCACHLSFFVWLSFGCIICSFLLWLWLILMACAPTALTRVPVFPSWFPSTS